MLRPVSPAKIDWQLPECKITVLLRQRNRDHFGALHYEFHDKGK
jgi:hypothetical protein